MEELLKLIEQVRCANTHSTANGSWTVPDNMLTIKVSDLMKIIKK